MNYETIELFLLGWISIALAYKIFTHSAVYYIVVYDPTLIQKLSTCNKYTLLPPLDDICIKKVLNQYNGSYDLLNDTMIKKCLKIENLSDYQISYQELP